MLPFPLLQQQLLTFPYYKLIAPSQRLMYVLRWCFQLSELEKSRAVQQLMETELGNLKNELNQSGGLSEEVDRMRLKLAGLCANPPYTLHPPLRLNLL